MDDIEFAGAHALLAPGLQELPVLVELHDARVANCGAAAGVAVADEDVAVGRDGDFSRRVELIHSGAGDALLSERHQHLAIRATEFEHLMAAVVGHPEIAVLVDGELVGADEQSRTKAFQQFARGIELEDRRDAGIGTGAGRAARSRNAASIDDPDRPIRRRRDARRRSPLSSGRQMAEVDARLIRDSADRCARQGATPREGSPDTDRLEMSAARRGRPAAAWWARRTNSPAAPPMIRSPADCRAAESVTSVIASAIATARPSALIFMIRPRWGPAKAGHYVRLAYVVSPPDLHGCECPPSGGPAEKVYRMRAMRIAIVGSGGVGGYFGGRLAATGADVTFIARGAHLAAMREHGLRIESPSGNLHVPRVSATDDPASVGPVDIVFFTVKLYDTESALAMLPPLIGPQTLVIPFQNGVDSVGTADANARRGARRRRHDLRHRGHRRTGLDPPHRDGAADLRSGRRPGAAAARGAARRRQAARDSTPTLSDRHLVDIWTKFARLSVFSGMTAVTRSPIGVVRADPDLRALMETALRESIAVARGKQIPLLASTFADAMAGLTGLPPQARSSMLEDLERGRRLELPWLSGAVVRIGDEVGVDAPTHRLIVTLLKPHVHGKQN